MLLISKFHDYYDSALGYGVDKKIVYRRKTENLKIDLKGYFKSLENPYYNYGINNSFHSWSNYGCISFCGTIYPYVLIKKTVPSESGLSSVEKDIYFFDPEDFYKINLKEFDKYKFYRAYYRLEHLPKKENIEHCVKHAQKYFDKIKEETNILELHHKMKSPILMFGDGAINYDYKNSVYNNITLNPCLKDIGFQRVVDPYTTFQEISMFMSGVLGTVEKDTINISDTDMRDAKGFDNMSFKKYPTKKRKK